MGTIGSSLCDPGSCWSLSLSAARVVPDIPTFQVDDGFWYNIPQELSEQLTIGAIVRVPLSGRVVRGFVTELGGHRVGLKDVKSISGSAAVFDEDLLKSLAWAAGHYVAPFSVLLNRARPPNLPRRPGEAKVKDMVSTPSSSELASLALAAALGKKGPVVGLVGTIWNQNIGDDLSPVLAVGGSVLIILATEAEVDRLAAAAAPQFGRRLVTVAGDNAARLTTAWANAQAPGRLVIATPRAAAWKITHLRLALVAEESRRAMKDRQTPTVHVRDLLINRSRMSGFRVAFVGPTPSVELLAGGADLIMTGQRPWGLVEVVDRTLEPPGSGYFSETAVSALRAPGTSRAFVFTHQRRGYGSSRCVTCRQLLLCHVCQAALSEPGECPRCQATLQACLKCGGKTFESMGDVPDQIVRSLRSRLGNNRVGLAESNRAVVVGTERDIPGLGQVDLVVCVDLDGLSQGRNYRSQEEALRIMARLGNTLAPGTGKRLMIQTSMPDSALIQALRRGQPIPYLESLLAERVHEGFPPAIDLLALELRGDVPTTVVDEIGGLAAKMVLGPSEIPKGLRWLLQGLRGPLRFELRTMVHRWREMGLKIRIDADPIDL